MTLQPLSRRRTDIPHKCEKASCNNAVNTKASYCIECARAYRAASDYNRKKRERNALNINGRKDKERAYTQRIKERRREKFRANPEPHRKHNRESYARKRERLRASGVHLGKYTRADWLREQVASATPDACIIWPFGKDIAGYGQVCYKGRSKYRAHRAAWEIFHGKDMPRELLGCHGCDVPSCVNPYHISPGTAIDNAQDMVRRGRNKNR